MAEVGSAERNEYAESTLDERDAGDLESRVKSTRELAEEIGRLRDKFVDRTKAEGEGVISEIESHRFVREARRLRSKDELQRLEAEFTEHLKEQRRLMEGAGQMLKDKSTLLNEGEEEEIMGKFPDMTLKQKDQELRRIQKMMDEREKSLQPESDMSEEIRTKMEEEMEKAKGYEERLKVIEGANESNRNFQKYKKLWETDKIADKTKTEYFEWFLSLSNAEQKWAIDKARKEDIEPRAALHDLHEQLPAKYRNPQFKNLGKTDRVRFFGEIERTVQREFAQVVWSQETDMSPQSKAFAIKAFEQIKGKDNRIDELDRILGQISNLEEFPKHAKAEAELRKQLEKFDPTLYGPFVEEFNRSSFEEKTRIIEKVRTSEKQTKRDQINFNKFEPEIKRHFEDRFLNTHIPEEKDRILTEMDKFREYRKEYFKLRKDNDEIFGTDIGIYERWYNEHVTDLEEARKALEGMRKMVEKRKKIFKEYENLDPRVQARCSNFESLPTKKKIEELKKLQKLQQNLEAIDALKETAETLEISGMEEKALDILKKARKLDPEDEEIKKSMTRLGKKLGKEEEVEELISSKEVEETKKPKKTKEKDKKEEKEEGKGGEDDVEEMESTIEDLEDSMTKIRYGQSEILRMRRTEETVEMVEDNISRIGVNNIKEDSRTRAGEEYEGNSDLEDEIIDEVTDSEQVVGRDGRIENVISVDFQGGEADMEDLREVQDQITSPRKRDVRWGATNVELCEKDNPLKRDRARDILGKQKRDLAEEKVGESIAKIEASNVTFTDEQMEVIEDVLLEQAQADLQRRINAEKIYKKAS